MSAPMILQFADVSTITLPLFGSSIIVSVNWGDGSPSNSSLSRTYASPGNYTVEIELVSGTLTGFGSMGWDGFDKLTAITQWGDWPDLTTLNNVGGHTLISVPKNIPSTVTNMFSMFQFCENFNDSNIITWDVSEVLNMDFMFYNASIFNQPIGGWNVGKVTSMDSMFFFANFNQDISSWDVSKVINAHNMLFFNTNFNQDVSNWNVGKMENMNNMFNQSSFNQSLARWNISSATTMSYMFNEDTLDTLNYSATLIGWAAIAETLKPNDPDVFHFDGGGRSIYENARAAYTTLTSEPLNWNISPGIGRVPPNALIVIATPALEFQYNAPTTRAYYQGVAINPYIPSFASVYSDVQFQISPVSPALPAGLQIDQATGKISGTPTAVVAEATYTIKATANAGATIETFSIILSVINVVSYIPSSYVFLKNVQIVPITPTVNAGATIIGYAITPAISGGLTFNTTTGIITGTPTSVLTQTYLITATTSTGINVNNNINITIADITYTPTAYTFLAGAQIAAIRPVFTPSGLTGATFAFQTPSPSGLTIGNTSGIITGQMNTIASSTPYTIALTLTTNGATYTKSMPLTFTVSTISYNPTTYNFLAGVAIQAIQPVIPTYSADPDFIIYDGSGLPSGIVLNSLTGIITGTPLSTSAGSNTAVIVIQNSGTVIRTIELGLNVLDLSYNPLAYTFLAGTPITQISPSSSYLTSAAALIFSPPANLSIDASGNITGIPLAAAPATTYNLTLAVSNTSYQKTIPFSFTVNNLSRRPFILKFSFLPKGFEIVLPLIGITGNFTVNWDDGTPITTNEYGHTYAKADFKCTVQITIQSGTLSGFGSRKWKGSAYLASIYQWGDLPEISHLNYIGGAVLIHVPNVLPRTVTDLSYMFYNAIIFNQPIGVWDVSNITNMDNMFKNANKFNQNLGLWQIRMLRSALNFV